MMSMMIVQLLVFTCAYALGAAYEVPAYGDIDDSIRAAFRLLDKNVLSMDGNIPGLDDPRRQYTSIIHVVMDEARSLNKNWLLQDYYKEYQQNINESLPYATANPEEVIEETNKMINDIINAIEPVVEVIQSVMVSVRDVFGISDNLQIDKVVDEEIKTNAEKYDYPLQVYLATGLVATQLNHDDVEYFAPNSQNFSADKFIITGAEKLEKNVLALNNLFNVLYIKGRRTV